MYVRMETVYGDCPYTGPARVILTGRGHTSLRSLAYVSCLIFFVFGVMDIDSKDCPYTGPGFRVRDNQYNCLAFKVFQTYICIPT